VSDNVVVIASSRPLGNMFKELNIGRRIKRLRVPLLGEYRHNYADNIIYGLDQLLDFKAESYITTVYLYVAEPHNALMFKLKSDLKSKDMKFFKCNSDRLNRLLACYDAIRNSPRDFSFLNGDLKRLFSYESRIEDIVAAKYTFIDVDKEYGSRLPLEVSPHLRERRDATLVLMALVECLHADIL
jgi:hypothetical protein